MMFRNQQFRIDKFWNLRLRNIMVSKYRSFEFHKTTSSCVLLLTFTYSTTELNMPLPFVEDIIKEKYEIEECVGQGVYGCAFQVKDLDDKHFPKILKMSELFNKFHEKAWKTEIRVLSKLESQRSNLFVKYYESFKWKDENVADQGQRFGCLVLSKGGVSLLESIDNTQLKKFSVPNVLKVGFALAKALEILHNIGYLHRDLHENNILLRNPILPGAPVTLIDFGLCLNYRTRGGRRIIQMGNDVNLAGTLHSSLRTDEKRAYKESDDFESMLYALLTCSGQNPFCGSRANVYAQKRDFHAHPEHYLGRTPWLLSIFLSIRNQIECSVWNSQKVLDAIAKSFYFNPEESVTHRVVEGKVIIH